MGKSKRGLGRRETLRLRKSCSIHRKAESDPHYTHTVSEEDECGCFREARARERHGDILPNKADNLGDAVSMC